MRKEIIGSVEVYNANCFAVIKTLERFDHLICDPPYDSEAHVQYRPRRKGKGGARDRSDLSFDSLDAETREKICANAKLLCNGWFLAFCQTEQVAFWRDDIEAAGLKYKSPMIWVKPDATPKMNGQGPAIGYESMVTAWCGPGYARWNAGGKRGVYTHMTNSKTRHGGHPTEKPLLLMRELITDFTEHGQIIFDPFGGSGTTGVAALQLGRRCILVEKDRKYFDICCERLHAASREDDMFIPRVKLKQDDMGFPTVRVKHSARGTA